jgi:hypothetical protein
MNNHDVLSESQGVHPVANAEELHQKFKESINIKSDETLNADAIITKIKTAQSRYVQLHTAFSLSEDTSDSVTEIRWSVENAKTRQILTAFRANTPSTRASRTS